MKLMKFDELDSLIRGMMYVETNNPSECYYFSDPTSDDHCHKVPYDFSNPYPFLVSGAVQAHLYFVCMSYYLKCGPYFWCDAFQHTVEVS